MQFPLLVFPVVLPAAPIFATAAIAQNFHRFNFSAGAGVSLPVADASANFNTGRNLGLPNRIRDDIGRSFLHLRGRGRLSLHGWCSPRRPRPGRESHADDLESIHPASWAVSSVG
jgi:hypothetical protein